uniref:NADH dehydrogenase subunit 4L n=1 Tax=Sericostoma personatum TaxID=1271737 RepID=A0A0U1Z7M6_9NEOP|nr:NADH dehydrogenase subunit 4L [Sericostoma personatum]QNE85905.1 NADH dehydrogenase subunit 4L [Sericostoma personatum]
MFYLLMKIIIFMLIYIFIVGNYIFCFNYKHLLIMLLMLELMSMMIFFMFYMSLIMLDLNFYYLMLFLLIMVCEGVLGISILVYMIRIYGSDYYMIYSFL